MDKKHILGSGIDYKELNALPELHIQRKKTPKVLENLATGLGEEKALKLFKNEVKSLFQQRFTGKSDYDSIKRKLARKIFLYNLSKLKNKRQETSKEGIPLNFTLAKW